MLPNINMLYLGASVLILLDLSYMFRFWTQFEAWLCFQTATPQGLVSATGSDTRYNITCLPGTPPSFATDLYDMWSRSTPSEAQVKLRSPAVRVTNASDKDVQLEKILKLDELVRQAHAKHETTTTKVACPPVEPNRTDVEQAVSGAHLSNDTE